MSNRTLINNAFNALCKEIPNIDKYLTDDMEEIQEEIDNHNLISFVIDMSTDKKSFKIKVSIRYIYPRNWRDTGEYDYDKITLKVTDMRSTNYGSISTSFIKRVRKIIENRENQLLEEKQWREDVKAEEDLIQQKINKINEDFDNCIEIYRDNEYDVGFPILVIGNEKYNICLEKNIVSLGAFRKQHYWSKPDKSSFDSYPLHLAIPFLQQVELEKLLGD